MTNQVAITMLKNLEQSLDDYCELNDEGKEAFHMAITALELFGNSEQLPSTHSKLEKNSQKLDNENGELISRQDAIDEIDEWIKAFRENGHKESAADACLIQDGIIQLPSAQMDRDIPVKPIETTDKAWGIPKKQAVCPKCDYYLSHISFLGDYKGKRTTYCETCGQAIDWEGWDWDEED